MKLSVMAAAVALVSGCASLGMPQRADSSSTTVIKTDPATKADPLTTLEQALTKVHSERVIVSTSLLRSLVKNERLQRTHCKNISGQLEAIKNIDLELEEPKE